MQIAERYISLSTASLLKSSLSLSLSLSLPLIYSFSYITMINYVVKD